CPSWVWLAQVLLQDRREAEAEAELRKAVDADKGEPERWLALLRLLVLTGQREKADQLVREAEASLTDATKAPLALAQRGEIVGGGEGGVVPALPRSWSDRARLWFDKAQGALKDPDDQTVRRRLAEFLLRTNRVAEAEGPLKEILARGKSPDLVGWAR